MSDSASLYPSPPFTQHLSNQYKDEEGSRVFELFHARANKRYRRGGVLQGVNKISRYKIAFPSFLENPFWDEKENAHRMVFR
jgi:hypothetical protein